MERTKLFISYSHCDQSWLKRLKVHLALLQRRGIVHVWSDTRIEVGARWQEEIEAALDESRIAVLLVSADFLASEFIWNEEMPKLLEHQKRGMKILPLIARPCAWLIAPELSVLQGRPPDGRPLSLGTEAEVDWDLAEFVYEIAGLLEQMPVGVAAEEVDEARARRRVAPRVPASALGARLPPATEVCDSVEEGQVWIGSYDSIDGRLHRRLRFVIKGLEGRQFSGAVEYLDDGSATNAQGQCLEIREMPASQELRKMGVQFGSSEFGVVFREIQVSKRGKRPPEIRGEYLGLVTAGRMVGIWQSRGVTQGRFDLQLQL